MRRFLLAAMMVACMAGPAQAAGLQVDADGTVHVPAFAVPPSNYMSAEAKQLYAELMRNPAKVVTDQGVARWRETHNQSFYEPRLAKAQARYPVDIQATKLGGVPVEIITAKGGVRPGNENRVLIELHGGSFMLGAVLGGRLESMPVAGLGGYRIVSVDYRQGPEFKFPAASQDVAAVYRALLKTHKPAQIGLYGCSAGGVLTAQALAWIQKEGLPTPGAAAMLCAPAESVAGGDARFWGQPLDVFFSAPPPPPSPNPAPFDMAYFSAVDPHDPLVAPAWHPDVLAKFPPTLLITGTRGIDLSGAAFTHTQMAKAGAESFFYAYEGMWHAFMYDVDLPEAQEAYQVLVKFFDKQLAK